MTTYCLHFFSEQYINSVTADTTSNTKIRTQALDRRNNLQNFIMGISNKYHLETFIFKKIAMAFKLNNLQSISQVTCFNKNWNKCKLNLTKHIPFLKNIISTTFKYQD